jgi:pyruvate/2-oxoglutarate dehydrogenase complex dihydrolipoamide acyltransferase (E2) component
VTRTAGLAFAALLTAGSAAAQTPASSAAAAVRVSFVVRPVLTVAVEPGTLDLGELPVEAGHTFRSSVPLTLRVTSNTAWTLAASLADAAPRAAAAAASAGPAPVLRLENIVPGRRDTLAPGRGQAAQTTLLSGGSTGRNGRIVRPDVVVDVPSGAAPGSYRMRLVLELKGQP